MTLTISEAAAATGLSPDTLRYYERIKLMPPPGRTSGGKRIYRDADVARLRFIRRAQAVGFSLDEIAQLVRFRENPAKTSRAVRSLAAKQHSRIKAQLETLETMEAELALLLSLCSGNTVTCPILKELDGNATASHASGCSQ